MKIDVFGAIFLDKYLYEDDSGIYREEAVGGSGLSIALGLHLLGHDVSFYGNIGNDERGLKVMSKLNSYGFPRENICIMNGITGLFVARNDVVSKVERGVNAFPLGSDIDSLRGEFAVITTELNKESLKKIVSNKWKQMFLDVGPRPSILKEVSLPKDIIKIGNFKESKVVSCHIEKLGPDGARWSDIRVSGNNKVLPYTIGAGDLFDTLLIHGVLRGREKNEVLRLAVELAEESCKIPGGFKLKNVIDKYQKYLEPNSDDE